MASSTAPPLPRYCALPYIQLFSEACMGDRDLDQDQAADEPKSLAERGGTDPNGQVLPEWLTWVEYTTTVAGEAVATGSVAQLPLTYYGPSIPLGDGWAYGGLTSPVVTPAGSPATSSSEDPPVTESLAGTVSSPVSTGSSGLGSQEASTPPSPTASLPSSSSGSSYTSQGSSVISRFHTSSALSSTTASTSSATASPRAEPSTDDSNHSNLVPLLPAILVPILVVVLLALLIALCIFRRSKRNDHAPASSSRGSSWLSTLFTASKGKAAQPTTPRTTRAFPSPPEPRSPNEKSALLPGFTAQHHRNSSSISATADRDELTELADQNQSLLQRLSLGLGWLASSSADSSRKPSGNVLERGLDTGYTKVPLQEDKSRSEGSGNNGSSGNGTPAGITRSLPDDQLFFSPPARTASSRDTSSGSRSVSSRGFGLGSRKSWMSRGSQPATRVSTPHRGDEVSVAVPDTPGTGGRPSGDLSEFGRRALWRESGERMRFPIPPSTPVFGGTFGPSEDSRRESIVTTESENPASFHTARSTPDLQDIPSVPLPPSATPGSPITRSDAAYSHAPLSAFGSHPATPVQDPTGHDDAALRPFVHQASRGRHHSPRPSGDVAGVHLPLSPLVADDAITPMNNLFAATPPQSELSDDHRYSRFSFAGEPFVDTTLVPTSAGDRIHRDRAIGEFGEPLRPGPDMSTLVVDRIRAQDHISEVASVHSHPSHAASHGGSSSSGSQASRAGRVISNNAIRGRRSQPQLLRASMLGAAAEKDLPAPPLLPLTPDVARSETSAQRRWLPRRHM